MAQTGRNKWTTPQEGRKKKAGPGDPVGTPAGDSPGAPAGASPGATAGASPGAVDGASPGASGGDRARPG